MAVRLAKTHRKIRAFVVGGTTTRTLCNCEIGELLHRLSHPWAAMTDGLAQLKGVEVW